MGSPQTGDPEPRRGKRPPVKGGSGVRNLRRSNDSRASPCAGKPVLDTALHQSRLPPDRYHFGRNSGCGSGQRFAPRVFSLDHSTPGRSSHSRGYISHGGSRRRSRGSRRGRRDGRESASDGLQSVDRESAHRVRCAVLEQPEISEWCRPRVVDRHSAGRASQSCSCCQRSCP